MAFNVSLIEYRSVFTLRLLDNYTTTQLDFDTGLLFITQIFLKHIFKQATSLAVIWMDGINLTEFKSIKLPQTRQDR